MGRELQKKKNRSGISKVRHKPKSKKRLLAHPIIAANWDQSQTLAQNYQRLGLTAKLNKNTGGLEKTVSDVERLAEGDGNDPLSHALIIANSTKRGDRIEVSEARIERDPTTGKILRVIDDGSSTHKPNPLNDPLNELDSDEDENDGVLTLRNQHGNTDRPSAIASSRIGKTETVRKLEAAASKPAAKYKRRQPEGEIEFVESLVRKYGDDYSKMARDIKINYMQRSEGDLKRRIKKWKENGGSVK